MSGRWYIWSEMIILFIIYNVWYIYFKIYIYIENSQFFSYSWIIQDILLNKKIDTSNITYILIGIKNNFRNETKTIKDSRYNVYIEYI